MIDKFMGVMISIFILSINSSVAMEIDEPEYERGITASQPIPILPSAKSIPMDITSPSEFTREQQSKKFLDVPFLSLITLNQKKDSNETSPKTSPMMISPTTEPKRKVSKTLPYNCSKRKSGSISTSTKSLSSPSLRTPSPIMANNPVPTSKPIFPQKEISPPPVAHLLNSSKLVPNGWTVKNTNGTRRFSLAGEDRGEAIDLISKEHIEKVSEALQKEILERKRYIAPLRQQRKESTVEYKETGRDGSITPYRERNMQKETQGPHLLPNSFFLSEHCSST